MNRMEVDRSKVSPMMAHYLEVKDKYPDTIEGVIYQPGQYQCVTNSHINKEPSESSYEAAESILDGRRMFRSSVVYQAEFIQGKVVEKVGNTYFCED